MKSFDLFIFLLSEMKKSMGSGYKLEGAKCFLVRSIKRSSARFKDLGLQGNYLINDICKYI